MADLTPPGAGDPGCRSNRGGEHDRRVLLLTQYFEPEVGAAQTRLRETVAGLGERGFRVTVVAPVPSYPLGVVPEPYRWWRPTHTRIDGATLVRLPTVAIPGARMSRRIVSQVAFAGASLATLALVGRHDVALVELPPLLLAGTARALRAAGLPYVFHVADPWPDFPIAMGYLRSPAARRLAFGIEDMAYRGAAAITTVSPGLVDLLSGKPSAGGRVRLLPNGVDTDRFDVDVTPADGRRRLGWPEGFTIVYVGTVGLAQGIGTLLEAAGLIDLPITIRIVGEGVEKPELVARAAAMRLTNLTFEPAVAQSEVPAILAAADAGLVILRAGPLFEQSLPTKLLETMAAARPVIVGADGLAARIVNDADGGYLARAEDAPGLARAIEACFRDPARDRKGTAARATVVTDYDRSAILDRLADILCEASIR